MNTRQFDPKRLWHKTPPADRDAIDWLYAAASILLRDGDEHCARRVMDYADDEVARIVRPVSR